MFWAKVPAAELELAVEVLGDMVFQGVYDATELAKERPGFFSVADRLVRVPIVPGLGSVLIKRDGKVLGAVGVSGSGWRGRPAA